MFGLLHKPKAEEKKTKTDPNSTTQAGRILRHLQKHHKITNIEINNMRILRGSERIRELRAEGYLIESQHVSGPLWLYTFGGHRDEVL